MPERHSVPTWDGEVLLASRINAGNCAHEHFDEPIQIVGIDLIAQDGTPFAHAHFDAETARRVAQRLIDAADNCDKAREETDA